MDNSLINSYNEFVIDFDFIEENMTDLLIRNKKLLSDEITEFFYNNEIFSNQLSDLITTFKLRYNKPLILDDKIKIFKFFEQKISKDKLINIINDFMQLIKFINNNVNNDYINKDSKIYEIINKIKDTSEIFIKIFENNDSLTINKIPEIFDCCLKLINNKNIIDEILNNQEKELDENSKKLIFEYFKKPQLISKKDFARALRLFITLVLLPEEDKENKIKNNRNNTINHLKSPDLWNKEIYNNKDFQKYANELKLFNVKINQIITLYKILGSDIEDNFFNDVHQKIEGEKKKDVEAEINDNIANNEDNDEDYDDDIFRRKKKEESDDESERSN